MPVSDMVDMAMTVLMPKEAAMALKAVPTYGGRVQSRGVGLWRGGGEGAHLFCTGKGRVQSRGCGRRRGLSVWAGRRRSQAVAVIGTAKVSEPGFPAAEHSCMGPGSPTSTVIDRANRRKQAVMRYR